MEHATDLISYLEIMFNDSTNPCCLSDLDSDKIIFMNVAMRKMLRISDDYSNLKCYQVMQGHDYRCSFCPNHSLEFAVFLENYIYNEKLDQYFRVNHTLLEYHGRRYNMCKYFMAPSFQQQQLSFEEAMKGCQRIITQDPQVQIAHFLELLGKFYNSERAYIHCYDPQEDLISCEEVWVKDAFVDNSPLQARSYDTKVVQEWCTRRNDLGIVEANSLFKDFAPGSTEDQVLKFFRLDNLLLCDLGDGKSPPRRMVGLSNRKEVEYDYRLLKAVSQFINAVGDPKAMEEIFQQVNDSDFLTGFYSRERYSRKVDALKKDPPISLGILFVNINGLRKTNEFFGCAQGDNQIKESAELLSAYFKEPFYRISGDEFVGFFPHIDEPDFAFLIDGLRDLMKQRDNNNFTMGQTWKSGRYNVEDMVVEADTIMYINKQKYYYTLGHDVDPSNKKLLNELLNYLRNDEFLVYLQPQVNLHTGEISGAEALIRRFDKEAQTMVFPDQFIPLYEQESIIRHVDIFVVEKVCQILSSWGETHRMIPISVNLSRVTLLEHGIVDTIARICDKYHVPHHYVIIEVTERVGLIENDVASALITQFMEQGFKISLDDFGCAYSNIVTLVKITVNEVKIDKSLVDDLMVSEKNQIIVGNMLNMCNSFQNTHTLAEGIEEEAQAEILREYGCSYGQGYLYSRPIPHEEFFQKYIDQPLLLEGDSE